MNTIHTLEQKLQKLPPDVQQTIEELVDKLIQQQPKEKMKMKFDWAGALADMKSEYTSVQLQHKALEWWGG